MSWPWETKTSTCRNFATISSRLYLFLAIAVLLDVDTYLKSDHFVGGGSHPAVPLRDLLAFRHVFTELFGSGLHVRPPSNRCGRRNAKKFTTRVMRVTARPTIQPISERFRTRKGFRRPGSLTCRLEP